MTQLSEWSDRYMTALHWFIPPQLHASAALLSRAQNVANAALIAAIAGPLYALAYQLLGFSAAAHEILLCCLVMLAAPFLLKLTASIVAARELFLCALFFNFTWLSVHLGGITAPTACWLITAPVVAMFLGGMTTALFWLVMSSTSVGAIYLLQVNGVQLPPHPVQDSALLYLLCDVGLFVVVVVFVLLFELTKTRGFVKLEEALNTINELAIRDELTGSHNRRYLLSLIEKEKQRSDRNGRLFSLCLFDIDFFKRINDTYGHAAGDEVLREFCKTVASYVRGGDSFGRYGGEEFLLMLPETPMLEAVAFAERVRAGVEKRRCVTDGSEIALTVSIGVAEFRQGEPVAQTVGRADEALYVAKSSGRNRVVCYGEDMMPPAVPAVSVGVSVARIIDGAHRDQLTGLLNRRLLRDRLRHAMDRANRNRSTVGLLLLNINKFKEVNHALGCEGGDIILAHVASTISGCLRDSDSVARWGGDEFIALLEDLASEADAQQVAEKVLDRLVQPVNVAGRECFVTLSVGIALYPAAGCDLDTLLKRADIAMHCAKAWGENTVQLYTPGAALPPSERLALKNGLRDALAQGQLFVEYQPQVDLASRRIVGVEALVRWQHPDLGRIDPGRFIPLAEETGLIVPIGEWVLRAACLQSRAWLDAGLPPVKTAVNLSARQLKAPGLVARVLQIVRETGMAAGSLDLEITEGILIEDIEGNRAVMSELRQAGVLVSIDDFGTGYSSLSYLSELPVDILKMDALFVRRLGSGGAARRSFALAESIVDMAHRLHLKVIAEAVETPEQLADLTAMQCDEAQGYLFARPLPADQVGLLLARQQQFPASVALA
ncbi:bifunctional diguanylate cyclase/phosphodiesterase [Massilia horti]|uniref:Diguanylate cyclase n=1 Tax=Massilia horti TaxID=2562153 RepID=A0A4Y9SY78_9BURK|nr:diguanylate cyclase [Massilia horti]TFW31811.1 diguanylate cyclase [Massilia horti]